MLEFRPEGYSGMVGSADAIAAPSGPSTYGVLVLLGLIVFGVYALTRR